MKIVINKGCKIYRSDLPAIKRKENALLSLNSTTIILCPFYHKRPYTYSLSHY